MPLSQNQRGALFMSLAMAGFTFNDSIVKLLSADLEPGQIIFVRGMMASAMIYLLARSRRAIRPIRIVFNRWVALRIIGEAAGTLTFIVGLRHIPIGIATAILQALPLAVTMGAAMFLGEPVGWRRWTAIIVGFLGVLIIVRPGLEGFSPYAAIIVATVLFAATRDISTRKVDPAIPALFLSAVTAPAVALSGLFLGNPFTVWSPLGGRELGLLFVAACLVLVAYQCIILSMRTGEISFIAPFRYTSFIYALALGYLMFGDVPDSWTLLGGAIVIGTGLYTLYRERVRSDATTVAATSAPRHTP